ncbi:acyl-CoA thioesterase [Thalassotalea mangrovi]|uniref:Acyl-CoA thioesterase n=1 Tax=Thalassotalea mangrovi TaxID=2572245 RepID=A0A4U1B517_9GAMM|nr:thioesterase family protein [Thalassotalea mangrovi]TKB45366.1 acyl-CoA thioesterase [Thalassotalea mangrovi]
MFSDEFYPRFSDTDALGHINNTCIPVWFEGAREGVFKLFTPDLDLQNWPLILAKIDVHFHAQIYYGEKVEIRTFVSRIGNSSFDVYQEVWQQGECKASGTAVMVHFCYQKQGAVAIDDNLKQILLSHAPTHQKNS